MSCEWQANGYFKPTGPWLEAAGYYADHSSFAVSGRNAFDGKRLVSSATAGEATTANVWEWTQYKCRLCHTDYIAIECVPYMADETLLSQSNINYVFAAGAVRLELSPLEDFSKGFFVEYEIFPHAEYASAGLSLFDAALGLASYGNDYHASLHAANGRSAYILVGETSPQADVAAHFANPLPSWTTQQFSRNTSGARLRPIWFPTASGNTFLINSDVVFNGSQPLTFMRAAMRFGPLEGGALQERIATALAAPVADFSHVYMSLGVHDAKVGAMAFDSFFYDDATDVDWLKNRRFARVKVRASDSNTFSITRRDETKQERSGTDLTPYEPFTVSGKSPGVRRIVTQSVLDSSATASPKTKSTALSATNPADLVWSQSADALYGLVSIPLSGNDATAWRASRLNSVAPLAQPSGQPRALSHDCNAIGKSLQVTTQCTIGTIGPTTTAEAAKLPSVAIIRRSNSNFEQMSRPGDADSGYVNPPQWVEVARKPEPDPLTYVPDPTNPLFTESEFLQYGADYAAWRLDPFGGGEQDISTSGVSGPQNGSPLVSRSNEWASIYVESPNKPWMRYADGSHVASLQQHAGQSAFYGAQSAGSPMSPVLTLDLPYFGNAGLADFLQIRTPGAGSLFPYSWTCEYKEEASSIFRSFACDGTSWKDRFEYSLWPAQWNIFFQTGVVFGNSAYTGFSDLRPTLGAWQYLASRRSMAAVTACTYTPLRLECVAELQRGSLSVSPAGAATADWPGSSYRIADAWADDDIPKHEAIRSQQRNNFVPLGGTVRLHFRKTWQIETTVTQGPAIATGGSSYRNEGTLVANQSFYQLPLNNPANTLIEIRSLQEVAEISWPGPSCQTQNYTFLHEDFWTVTVSLTEQQWQSLENGEAVTLQLRQDFQFAGSNPYRNYVSNSNTVTTRRYTASAGGVVNGSAPTPEAKNGFVDVQMAVTLQFA